VPNIPITYFSHCISFFWLRANNNNMGIGRRKIARLSVTDDICFSVFLLKTTETELTKADNNAHINHIFDYYTKSML